MREIRDELYVAKGRLSVVGLQETLNVDLVHIEERVDELLKTDGQLNLIQGELIDQCVAAVPFVYTQLARFAACPSAACPFAARPSAFVLVVALQTCARDRSLAFAQLLLIKYARYACH